jgi:hypothetical protein
VRGPESPATGERVIVPVDADVRTVHYECQNRDGVGPAVGGERRSSVAGGKSRTFFETFLNSSTTQWLAVLSLGIPLLMAVWILVYSLATPGTHASYLGTGMLVGLASLLAGCLAGFLFGVPRVVSSGQFRHSQTSQLEPGGQGPTTAASGPAGSGGAGAVTPSSNLAEVSDWLTKLLLGAGLVQLTHLGRPIGQLVDAVAAGLFSASAVGAAASGAKVMAGAILFGFAFAGFLDGYVVTTTWYQRRLSGQEDRVEARAPAAPTASAPPKGS